MIPEKVVATARRPRQPRVAAFANRWPRQRAFDDALEQIRLPRRQRFTSKMAPKEQPQQQRTARHRPQLFTQQTFGKTLAFSDLRFRALDCCEDVFFFERRQRELLKASDRPALFNYTVKALGPSRCSACQRDPQQRSLAIAGKKPIQEMAQELFSRRRRADDLVDAIDQDMPWPLIVPSGVDVRTRSARRVR